MDGKEKGSYCIMKGSPVLKGESHIGTLVGDSAGIILRIYSPTHPQECPSVPLEVLVVEKLYVHVVPGEFSFTRAPLGCTGPCLALQEFRES